jgi:hypothetical protein
MGRFGNEWKNEGTGVLEYYRSIGFAMHHSITPALQLLLPPQILRARRILDHLDRSSDEAN